jgi:uncharacterized caspase-like protein
VAASLGNLDVKTSIAGAILALLLPLALIAPSRAQTPEPRLALVLGNAEYRTGPLATAANDAGLIAETLRNAGFDVTGAANLDQDQTRRAFREFLEKANAAGPQAVIFVYLSGRGLQFEGENYFVPVDATIARDSDVPGQAVRISDLTRPLAGTPSKARMFVLDLARANNFSQGGQPLAPGLVLVEPEDGSLYAFNAAPGTVAPEEQPPYGAYGQALSAMMREGGLPVDEVFARTRLRVNEVTRGAEVPWDASKINVPFVFFEPAPGAPAPAVSPQARAEIARRPIRDFPADDAYAVALDRDTIPAYQEFLQVYPTSPLSPRVRALLAARREALIWRRCVVANRPEAYWTYIRRYPRGPHIADARRRLALISAPLDPPAQFAFYDYDVPPPPPDEIEIIDRRRTYFFDDPAYAPPPPVPVLLMGPREREREYYYVPPPPPPTGRGFLPIPVGVPIPNARPIERQGGFAAPAFMPLPPRTPTQGAQPAQVPPGAVPGAAPQAGQGGRPGQPAQPSAAAPPHQLPGGKPLPPGAQPAQVPPVAVPGAAPQPGQGGRPGQPAQPSAAAPPHQLPGGKPLPPDAQPAPHEPGAPVAPAPAAQPAKPLPGAQPQPTQPSGRAQGAHGGPTPVVPAAAPKPAAPTPHAPPAGAPAAPKPAGPKPAAPPPAAMPKPAAPPAVGPHAAPPPAAPHVAPPPAVAPRVALPPAAAPRPAPPPAAAPHIAPPPAAAAPHIAPPPTAAPPRPVAPPPAAPKPPPPAGAAPHPAAPAGVPAKPACGAPGLPPCH